jgi:gliding motility-associated lipoprotein GldH
LINSSWYCISKIFVMNKALKSILIILIALTACKSEPAYEQLHTFKGNTWNRFDNQVFEIPVNETGKTYDIFLTMKRTAEYAYEDLPVNVVLQTPSGEERIHEFTFKLSENLKNPDSDTADSLTAQFELWKEILLSDKGKCTITIENLIPKIATPGIVSVGIIMKKSKGN